jgi:hypothetical protein
MYSYSFRPTYPVYQRSAQLLLIAGLLAGVVAGASLFSTRGQLYANLPLVVFSIVSFTGFIVQYVRYSDRKERGHFFVVDIGGFHSYSGRNNDVQMKWDNVRTIDRDGQSIFIEDIFGKSHEIYFGHYQRIDRLRMECLMHQFHMHHLETQKVEVTSAEFATAG